MSNKGRIEVSEAKDWLWDKGFKGIARCGSFAMAHKLLSARHASERERLDKLEAELVAARDAVALAAGAVDAQIARVHELYELVEEAKGRIEGGAK